MAFFNCYIYSKELNRGTNVFVSLPIPEPDDRFAKMGNTYPQEGQKYQTLYLLHGMMGDCTYWERYTGVERYAQAKKLAVVMPTGDNSMYTDHPYAGRYFEYITQELPDIMESIFPLSNKRENRFVAGLSMGGYGAMRAGILKPERYGAAVCLSAGFNLAKFRSTNAAAQFEDVRANVYGPNLERYDEEQDDLIRAVQIAVKNGKKLPDLFLACGTEDFIYRSAIEARDGLKKLGVKFTYEESPGEHTYDFWDPYIRKAISEWLPLANGFV